METTQQTAETPAIVTQFLEFLDKENAREAFKKAYNENFGLLTGIPLKETLIFFSASPETFVSGFFDWNEQENPKFWTELYCKWAKNLIQSSLKSIIEHLQNK